jgi:peptide/nickel transport system ATP-binding protein
MHVLDPVYTVGAQIQEAIRNARPEITRKASLTMAKDSLQAVGIEASRVSAYPHELSGGMRQRVCIAMAVCLEPDLIIADEPTTALDVITQDRVLGRLLQLQEEQQCALMLISHDMGVIAENCNSVAVVYAGRVLESGSVDDIFDNPSHPYTLGLINALPDFLSQEKLVSIPGFPPGLQDQTEGCPFQARCPFREDVCSSLPVPAEISPGHWELCHFPEKKAEFQVLAAKTSTWENFSRSRVGGGKNVDG